MPVSPTGQIIDDKGNPTGQTVNVNTGVVNTGQNVPASQGITPATPLPTPASPSAVPAAGASSVASTMPPTASTTPATPPTASNATQKPLPQTPSVVDLLNAAGQPSDFASRTKLAGQFGIAGYTGTATQNLQLGQKFRDMYEQKKGTEAPANGAEARGAVADYNTQNPAQSPSQQDPQKAFMDSYYAMNPVVKNLYDTLHTITDTTATKMSFVDTYNQLRQQQGIPELNSELLNIHKVMRGTEQDIRDEITKAGGTATESQIQAMVSTRNRLLQKQAANITDQLQVANSYVDQTVKLTQADRQQTWDQLDRQIGLTEKMATIQTDMNNAARTNYQKVVENIGYDGLANTLKDQPGQQRQVEALLGLPGGSLSNPTFIANAKTMKEQTLAATMENRDILNQLARERIAQGGQRISIDLVKSGLAPSLERGTGGTSTESGGSQTSGQPQIPPNPYQDKLEEQYDQKLMKTVAARSGDLGVQNNKVSQAIHLRALVNQYYDPQTKEYNIPSSQYEELAMGLATLVAPSGSTAVADRQQLLARTGASTINGALQFLTGTPQNGNTQAMTKNLIDSIDRQGQVAQDLRETYMKNFIGKLAPTSLDPIRKARVEQAQLPQYSKTIGLQIGAGFKDGDQQTKGGWLYQRDANGAWNPIKKLQ